MTLWALYRAYRYSAERRRLLLMLCYSASAAVVVYPILDFGHTQVALVPFLLTGAGLLAGKCRKVSLRDGIAAAFLLAVIAIILPFLSLKTENVHWSQLSHFSCIRIDGELEETVKKVASYIGEEENYILDASAAVYHIPMGIYKKDYDIFLNGNLGTKSPLELVEALRGKGGIILILREEYILNRQTPVEAVQYVRRHCEKVGEVDPFEVYQFWQ